MIVIAVANQKGGSGKTTITRELTACLAYRGYSVLVVDNDPQANLSESWLEPDSFNLTLANVLVDSERNKERRKEHLQLCNVIAETPVVGLDIVPSSLNLARFDHQPEHTTHRLNHQLKQHASKYDLVFIDCPPQLGKLLSAALYAADCVLIPCAATALGINGLIDLAITITEIRESVNPRLKILGAVINMYKINRNLSAEVREAVESVTPEINHVFSTNIHDYSKIAEAPTHKQPVFGYAPDHRAADQFWELTDEFCDALRLPRNNIKAVK